MADMFGTLALQLQGIDEAFQEQLKHVILQQLHEQIDSELERLARDTAARVYSELRYFMKPQEFAAELHHVITIRKQQ